MAEKMNGFNFGTTMKKIFFAIIALAALVGCNTNVMEEVATTPQYLTTSFEVDLNGESRVFNENLEWSWTVDDKIAAYQVAGEQIVNTLSLKANGKFGTDEFKYATNDPADFVFVYPVEALNADKSLGYVQTGVWTPTLVGIVNDATVNNIGTVEMNHMSAAFEIRVWDEGRQARKTISAATITSETEGGVSASLTNRSTNTVVFNVAGGEDKGKNVVYDITLVDENDRTYTISNKELNFVNGKRTILNVEWKYPKVTLLAYSSYNQTDGTVIKNDGLSGNAIYVKDVVTDNIKSSDIAAIKLLLNNSESIDITNGSGTANGLAYDQYSVGAKLTTKNGATYTYSFGTVYVTGIPYHADWRSKDNSDWSLYRISDKGTVLKVDNGKLGCLRSPAFYTPNGSMQVFTAIAACTGATSAGDYDRSYYYAGNRSTSASESGSYVIIPYESGSANNPNTPLVAGADAITLTTDKPCVIHTAKDFALFCETSVYQIKITYNKQ